MKRDVPDYKPFPLRPPFLVALLLLVSSLFAILEYLLHTLPQEHNRTAIPHDSPYVPFRKRSELALDSAATRHTSTTTRHEKPDRRAIQVLPSGNYAGTGIVTTYITVADRWYGNAGKPFQRTPLFPDDDGSGKCVYYYAGIVVTKNPSGCLAVIGLPDTEPLPPGLKRAPWFRDAFAFPIDSTCGEDMLQWFRTPHLAQLPGLLKPEEREIWMGSLSGMFRAVESCIYQSGPSTFVSDELAEASTSSSSTSATDATHVLKLYLGLTARLDGVLMRLMGGDPVVEKYCSLSSKSGVSDFGVLEMNSGARQTLMIPRLITMPVAPEVPCSGTSALAGSTTSSTITGASSQASIASPTARPESSTPSPTTPIITTPVIVADPAPTITDMEQVWVSVTLRVETLTSYTTNGSIGYSITTISIPTSVLMGIPAVMVTPSFETITDSAGSVTVVTTFPNGNPILKDTTTTLTNSLGSPTATVRTSVPSTSYVRTTTDANGNPTTQTVFPVIPIVPDSRPAEDIVPITRYPQGVYFIVYFLPALLTALLLIPVQALDAELKLMMPYRLLTKASPSSSPGAATESGPELGQTSKSKSGDPTNANPPHITTDTPNNVNEKPHPLTLPTRGLSGRLSGFRLLLHHRDPLPLLGDALVACAAMLVALSGETVGMKLRGSCLRVDVSSCLITVATFPGPARAVEALLGLMILLVIALWWVLGRWKSGVAAHPGSVATVCGLLQVKGTVGALRGVRVPEKELGGVVVKLGWTEEGPPGENYGLVVEGGVTTPVWRERTNSSARGLGDKFGGDAWGLRLHVPRAERATQGAFLVFLVGLLTLILYYEENEFSDPSESAFEAFMDSQSFGVTMLFSVLGEVATFTWDHIHNGFAETAIYLRMAQHHQPASLSVLVPRPTNVFSGFWCALRRRDPLSASIAFAGILSKFLPALLSSIPFASAQTWKTHEICTWTTVAVLAVMIIVLLGHIRFARWPDIPVPVGSLAGTVYYVCDSYMLKDFERLSMLRRRERDRKVERMARMYKFGWTTGVSGERRIGCDYAEGGQGFRMRNLAAQGFGVGGRVKGK